MSQATRARELAPIIGLEVHVQLETETKIFCGCSTDTSEAAVNTHTCPVCLGLPGALPVVNEQAIEMAVKIGKALAATIPEETRFHRKNYYYPDLPKNFQITQYDNPICQDGSLELSVSGDRRVIGIERAHLEEDPGSLKHEGGNIDRAEYTKVDYNRAGTPLMEIVTQPDFRSPKEARAFLRKLTEVLEYLGVFDTERDGSLRVDANISLVEASEIDNDGTIPKETLRSANRTEVKNISSHKGAQKALAYEITRQRNAVQRGRAVEQETRHWDENRGVTVSMRSKEAEKDYRYFREADLPPLRVSSWKDEIEIPELPDARRKRFQAEYGLGAETASKLTATKQTADFYESLTDTFEPNFVATWVADLLLGELHYRDMELAAVEREAFAQLLELVSDDEITEKNAEEIVLRTMLDEDLTPAAITERENLGKTDDDAVASAVHDAIENNPDAVTDYHAGEAGALNYLVGQVMAATGGSADPQTVNELFKEELTD